MKAHTQCGDAFGNFFPEFCGEYDREDGDREEDEEANDGGNRHQSQATEHEPIFRHACDSIRNRFGGEIDQETATGLEIVGCQAGSSGKKGSDNAHRGIKVTKGGQSEKDSAGRPHDRVNGVPEGIAPWDFIGKKFDREQDSCKSNDPPEARIAHTGWQVRPN